MKEFLKLGTDAYDVIRLFPDLLPQQQGGEVPESARDMTEKELEDSLLALIDYLVEKRSRLQSSDTQVWFALYCFYDNLRIHFLG